jgi:hypothetical protein
MTIFYIPNTNNNSTQKFHLKNGSLEREIEELADQLGWLDWGYSEEYLLFMGWSK